MWIKMLWNEISKWDKKNQQCAGNQYYNKINAQTATERW